MFNKKLTAFSDELVIKSSDNAVRWEKPDGQTPQDKWVEG